MEQRKQCGFALPVTVFALVVVGVITTGGFFMAHQEGRIGVASEHAGLAFYLTERGLVDAMGKWNSALYSALPHWGDTAVTQYYSGLGEVTTRVTRMTDHLFFLDVEATVTRGGAMLSGGVPARGCDRAPCDGRYGAKSGADHAGTDKPERNGGGAW